MWNPIKKLKTNIARKKFLKAQADQNKKRNEMLNKLRTLRELVHFIDKQLPTRVARKQFWRDFIKNHQTRLEVIDNFIQQLERK